MHGTRGCPGSIETGAVLRVAPGLVVDSFVDAHELLGDPSVGDRHRLRRPATWRPRWVQQAANRVRGDRLRQLRVAALGHPARGQQAMLAAILAGAWLVDVVQQGGDRDELGIDLDPGRGQERRCLRRDPADAARMRDDPIG